MDLVRLGLERLEGWCWEAKAQTMYECAVREGARVMVEVGVYGGRSLVPLIMAARETGGYVWGVDAWSNGVATTIPYGEANNRFWAEDDLGRVKSKLFGFLGEHQLGGWVGLVEASSLAALPLFADGSVDLLHVDAAHSVLDEARDVASWLMKLRKGGVLIIDDTDRADVEPAVRIAESVCETLHTDAKYVVMRKVV